MFFSAIRGHSMNHVDMTGVEISPLKSMKSTDRILFSWPLYLLRLFIWQKMFPLDTCSYQSPTRRKVFKNHQFIFYAIKCFISCATLQNQQQVKTYGMDKIVQRPMHKTELSKGLQPWLIYFINNKPEHVQNSKKRRYTVIQCQP